eukprot:366003-Chlamydomonas_euryale.AAC.3
MLWWCVAHAGGGVAYRMLWWRVVHAGGGVAQCTLRRRGAHAGCALACLNTSLCSLDNAHCRRLPMAVDQPV